MYFIFRTKNNYYLFKYIFSRFSTLYTTIYYNCIKVGMLVKVKWLKMSWNVLINVNWMKNVYPFGFRNSLQYYSVNYSTWCSLYDKPLKIEKGVCKLKHSIQVTLFFKKKENCKSLGDYAFRNEKYQGAKSGIVRHVNTDYAAYVIMTHLLWLMIYLRKPCPW